MSPITTGYTSVYKYYSLWSQLVKFLSLIQSIYFSVDVSLESSFEETVDLKFTDMVFIFFNSIEHNHVFKQAL